MENNEQPTDNSKMYKKLLVAVAAGIAVAAGVFFDAIPLEFIGSIFQQPSQ